MAYKRTRYVYVCPKCGWGGYETDVAFAEHFRAFHKEMGEKLIKKTIRESRKIEVPGI